MWYITQCCGVGKFLDGSDFGNVSEDPLRLQFRAKGSGSGSASLCSDKSDTSQFEENNMSVKRVMFSIMHWVVRLIIAVRSFDEVFLLLLCRLVPWCRRSITVAIYWTILRSTCHHHRL